MSSTSSNSIFDANPYETHPSLTLLEAEVLWEYAKLAQHIKMINQKTRSLGEEPDKRMLARLRLLENKMGLVLTLFKASVWGVINEQPTVEPSQAHYNDSSDLTIRR